MGNLKTCLICISITAFVFTQTSVVSAQNATATRCENKSRLFKDFEEFVRQNYLSVFSSPLIQVNNELSESSEKVFGYAGSSFFILAGFALGQQISFVTKGSENQRIWNDLDKEIEDRIMNCWKKDFHTIQEEIDNTKKLATFQARYRRSVVGGFDDQLEPYTKFKDGKIPNFFETLDKEEVSPDDKIVLGKWTISADRTSGVQAVSRGETIITYSYSEQTGRSFELITKRRNEQVLRRTGTWAVERTNNPNELSRFRGVITLYFQGDQSRNGNIDQSRLKVFISDYTFGGKQNLIESLRLSGRPSKIMLSDANNLFPASEWMTMDSWIPMN